MNNKTTTEYAEKLNQVEKELLKIKKSVKQTKTPISLKGILKGVTITEKDFQAAKKSLFNLSLLPKDNLKKYKNLVEIKKAYRAAIKVFVAY